MKTNIQFLAGVFVLSVYLISCYPEKKILGRYPDGKIKVVRYYKRGDSLNERYVTYYDNGKKHYVRYWRNDLDWLYKTKAWYKNGAKQLVGWRKYKDTIRNYNLADSEYIFTGLSTGYAKEWYESGKVKFKTVTKDNLLLFNYYNEQGLRNRQVLEKVIRSDGYDTVDIRIRIEPNGRRYSQQQRQDYWESMLYDDE